MTKRKYLATSDVARICQVTAVTVGNWIRSGKLSASRVPGGNYRIARQDLIQFLKQSNMPVPSSLNQTRIRVLIIEHDQEVLGRISNFLAVNDKRWNIEIASDCFTAGAKVTETEPDLVIMDVLMPGIDPEVCKQVKQTSAWKRAKVLAIVTNDQPASLAKAQSIGADCTVSKAFTDDQLRWAVFGLLFGKGGPV